MSERAELIRVRGLVQGVGFRPTVWRLARRHGLRGSVLNDGQGVRIHVCGAPEALDHFVSSLLHESPPLARIDQLEHSPAALLPYDADFQIAPSETSAAHTAVVPDAASCRECVAEIFDPFARRFRYPFTNCTHCGPRLAIVEGIPYDRAATTMRKFALCPECAREYAQPEDRRFHAQPVACHVCGPRAELVRADGAAIALDSLTTLDAADAVCTLLLRGQIVAVKGLGGFQLACDATNEAAVARLRERKRRERKPFALMARDLQVVRRFCAVSEREAGVLAGPAAPIVLLQPGDGAQLAPSVAPGLATLGFMLPNTPLHHLMLRRMERPLVMTSGNLSDEPQCIDNEDARRRLGGIAEYFLLHNRDIARRVDDSVVRVVLDAPRLLRRGRGYAPACMPLPPEFAAAPPILACGGELKNSFCLLEGGQAILSHHMGDLAEARTFVDFKSSVEQYLALFQQDPRMVAVDLHPEYLSGKLGRALAQDRKLDCLEVQHHHAHIASCMAENGVGLEAAPILGVALDGLGFGADQTLWGGEFLLASYRECRRLATFKPVAMPGGERAVHEPWRNTYAHLMAEMGWPRFAVNYADLELYRFLDAAPRELLDGMLANRVNSPLASSCGRLFDAAAAACGVCRERAMYEGQAAIEFEALVDADTLTGEADELAYPFAIPRLPATGMPYVEPLAMWQALLGDLILATPTPVIAARFHKGLAIIITRMVEKLSRYESAGTAAVKTVALSGGVFQNRTLLEQVTQRLQALDFQVLLHQQVPANDGGLALGQAVVAAARSIRH
jgi:hydrogenase maturation protein HypF